MIAIEVFSDIVCPWCFIGTQRLEQVLGERGDAAEVRYRTFLLDPNTPAAGKNIHDMLRLKYGHEPAPLFARVESEARATGIPLELAKQPMMYSTVRAHTLLRHAHTLGTQRALAKALFEAYFLEARDIADPDVLVPIAAAHGLPPERTTALLTDEAELALTRREGALPAELGIRGAPFFIVNGSIGIPGAQPIETFRQILAKV